MSDVPSPTPQALHHALVRVGGHLDLISDLELAEMGVSRERAADYVEFIRELSETLQQPLGSENDLLLYLQELADLHHLPAAE